MAALLLYMCMSCLNADSWLDWHYLKKNVWLWRFWVIVSLFFLQIAGKGGKGWGRKVSLFLLLYFSIFSTLWLCFCLCGCKNRSQIRPRTKCAHSIPVWCSFCGSFRSLISILASWFCINAGLILEQFLLHSIVLCLSNHRGSLMWNELLWHLLECILWLSGMIILILLNV